MHLPVSEGFAHLALNVLLETPHNEPLAAEVLCPVVGRIRDRSRIQHVHQARETPRSTVMGRSGEQNQGVRTFREQLRQTAPHGARAAVGDIVRFVNDDDVPVGSLQIRPILGALLEGVDRDDRLVVVEERIVVGRNPTPHSADAVRVQPREGNREAVPEFLLELGQHTAHRQHEDPAAPAPGDEFAYQDACLQGLAEADSVGNQDPLPWLP